MELGAPEPNILEVLQVIDSEIEAGMNFEVEDYGFTMRWRLE